MALEIKQEGNVIAKVYDLTANQLIILLNHYRGTENLCPQMGTDQTDREYLQQIGLLEVKEVLGLTIHVVTPLAHSYVNNILSVTIKEEETITQKVEPTK